MSKYNTDCFSHNVLLDLFRLQHQLCISRPFGTCFLHSKESPLFTFLRSVLEQDRRFELPPSVWKTDVLTVNTNLAYKSGEPSSPRAIFNVVFLTRWFHHKLSACFYGGFYASHTKGTTWFSHLYMTKKISNLPLNAKKHPYFRFESRGVFAPVSVFSLTVFSLFYRQTVLWAVVSVKHRQSPPLEYHGTCQEYCRNL